MKKIFRKYGKYILALSGVALMFIFVNPAKNSGGGARPNVEMGRLGGKKVMSYDLIPAQNILQTIQATPDYMHPPYNEISFLEFPRALNNREPALHLFLLLKEAEKYGISVSGDEINQEIHNTPIRLEDFDAALQKAGVPPTELYNVVSAYLKLEKLRILTSSALRPSLPEIEHLAADIYSKANAQYVVLDAAKPQAGLPAPTDAEMETQFKTYKDILPAAEPPEVDGHHFPFAYKYPDRVKVEYLAFDHQAVKERVAAAMTPDQMREDQRAAYHYYQAHPEEFTVAAQGAGATSSQQPYEQVAGKLVDRMLDDRTMKLSRQMAEEAVKIAGGPWKTIDTEGFHDAVAQKEWISYASIADTISGESRFLKYHPAASSEDGWATQVELNAMPGIGESVLPTQQNAYSFASLALHVREITREAKEPVFRLLQTGVEGPILVDERGNLYVYRVTDAQQSHSPESFQEVKEKVVGDIQKRKTFEAMTAEGKRLAHEAQIQGLRGIANAEKLRIATTGDFTRVTTHPTQWGTKELSPTPLPDLGVIPAFSDAVFRLAQPGNEGGATTAPSTTQAVKTGGDAIKTTSVPVDNRLQVFVLELVDFQPMTRQEFDAPTVKNELIGMAELNGLRTFLTKWQALSAAAQRVDYVPAKEPLVED